MGCTIISTNIAANQGCANLSTIKDFFDGFIVAYQLGKRNSVALVTHTIQAALRYETHNYKHPRKYYFLKSFKVYSICIEQVSVVAYVIKHKYICIQQRRNPVFFYADITLHRQSAVLIQIDVLYCH